MDRRVQEVIAFMTVNIHRDLSLAKLAQSARLSPAHLRRLFKTQTGVGPVQYLRALRMRKALELVETGTLSVKEIAARVGISDVSHFVRDFKKTYGVAPVAHRALYYKRHRERARGRRSHSIK